MTIRTGVFVKSRFAGAIFLMAMSMTTALAQDQNKGQDTAMAGMQMDAPVASPLPSPHAGSGTGWQPASVPANEWMTMRGGWELMAHGVIFVDYNQQGGPRGAGKAESVNWGMLMEQHKLCLLYTSPSPRDS